MRRSDRHLRADLDLHERRHPSTRRWVRGRVEATALLIGTTLRGNQVRLRLPPEAAAAQGRPKGAAAPMNQSREAHRSARPHHSPEGVVAGAFDT
jgi:hypothetical protein